MFKKYFLLFLFLGSCSYYSPIYWSWKEWSNVKANPSNYNSFAKLDWTKNPGIITFIDGIKVGDGFKKARLTAGKHMLEFAYFPAEFGTSIKGNVELDLLANHIYKFHIKLCYSCNPRNYEIWIEDVTTLKRIVWSSEK